MSFLTPAAFALAILLPLIIAMYLLKLRRTEQEISSVYLWRRMVQDVEANAPWQRLRRNLLLILQLLFLASLILALMRPFTWVEGASGSAVILILDTSASMAATDVPPNRLEAAKDQARRQVDGLGDETRVTIISAGDGAQVLVASSQDRRQIRQALTALQVGTSGSDLTTALELASAVAARQTDTEIFVFSDGRTTFPQRMDIKGRVRYFPQGVSSDNQAISLLSLEPSPGGESLTAFAQITNYSAQDVQRRLLFYADGTLVNAFDLEIPPGGQRTVIVDNLPITTRILEARLAEVTCTPTCPGDIFPLDDRAWDVHRTSESATIILVTEGNLFLSTALALMAGLDVVTVRPEDWENGRLEESMDESLSTSLPSFQPSNLIIFDIYVPVTTTIHSANILYIAPPRSTNFFTVTGMLDGPTLRAMPALGGVGVGEYDPLLTHVDINNVNVLDAVRIPLPPWARMVVAGDVGAETLPMLFAGEIEGARLAVLSFDLHHSDLPLQVAFPLLLSNLLSWLTPGIGGDLPTQVTPGTAVGLSLPADVAAVETTRPDGSKTRMLLSSSPMVFADTTQLGVYRVAWESSYAHENGQPSEMSFAVNLFSPQESDVTPAGALPLVEMGQPEEGEHNLQARQEWWRLLAFIALALMVIEWMVYQRAVLARLWNELKMKTYSLLRIS